MNIIESTANAKWARAVYDFTVDGGAVGDIPFRGDGVPLGAIISDVMIDVLTVVTGASATLAIKLESAADLQSAAAISGAPWSTATPKRATFTATSTPFKTTADRRITATVGTANLTAGKIVVWVRYQ